MAEISYPFDAGTGAIVTEEDWSEMARLWQDDGVISANHPGTSLEVTTKAEANTVYVQPGSAYIQGFTYRNTAELPLEFSTNASGNPRIDRVVLRLDRDTNQISAAIKEGIPASSPVAPDLDTTYPIHEISLATYEVGAGSSVALVTVADRVLTSRFIKVSTVTTGHQPGTILWNPSDDKFYKVGSTGIPSEIGSGGGGGGGGATMLYKPSDTTITGSTSWNIDPHMTFEPDGISTYLIEGMIYYWSNTPASSLNWSLGGSPSTPPNPKTRLLYQTSSTVNPTLSVTSGSIPTIAVGAVASNTFYSIEFQVSGRFAWDDPEFDTIYPAYQLHNAGHQFTISAFSWMRITALD